MGVPSNVNFKRDMGDDDDGDDDDDGGGDGDGDDDDDDYDDDDYDDDDDEPSNVVAVVSYFQTSPHMNKSCKTGRTIIYQLGDNKRQMIISFIILKMSVESNLNHPSTIGNTWVGPETWTYWTMRGRSQNL